MTVQWERKRDFMFSIVIEKNFNTEVIESKRPVLLAYFNKEDDSGEQFGILENVAEELGDQVKICLLSSNFNLAAHNLCISGSPTYIGFSNGKRTGHMLGRVSRDTLMIFIMETLMTSAGSHSQDAVQIFHTCC
jgi:hypothetical protein